MSNVKSFIFRDIHIHHNQTVVVK